MTQSEPSEEPQPAKARLVGIDLDQTSLGSSNPNIEHEREVAIFDILDGNSFALDGRGDGPYRLHLSIQGERLVIRVANEAAEDLVTHMLSLTPFKRLMKDYFIVCESYYQAIRNSPPAKIQAIDMGRRGLHDEGSRILIERLAGKITTDFDTARRLFTLICALHWKG